MQPKQDCLPGFPLAFSIEPEESAGMTRQKDGKAPSWLNHAKKLATARWSENHDYQRNAVYLTDPLAEKQIDRLITSEIWPVALKTLAATRFRVWCEANPRIEREHYIHACHSVNIVVEDPKRPFIAGVYPPWYARLNVRCTISGPGMFQDYLSINLPMSIPFQTIIDVLSEVDNGIPPTLSVNHDPENEKALHIAFENGGSGSGMNAWLSPGERIERKLKAYCDFIEVACEIENEPREQVLFRKLIREVNSIFQI